MFPSGGSKRWKSEVLHQNCREDEEEQFPPLLQLCPLYTYWCAVWQCHVALGLKTSSCFCQTLWICCFNFFNVCKYCCVLTGTIHAPTHPFMYSATTPSGPWPPSKGTSFLRCSQFISFSLLFLGPALHPNGQYPPTLFLASLPILYFGFFH